MFTIIITLLLPLVSIGIWRQSILKNNKKSGQSVTIGKGEYVLRYLTCLLCMLVIPWILLSLTVERISQIHRTGGSTGIDSAGGVSEFQHDVRPRTVGG